MLLSLCAFLLVPTTNLTGHLLHNYVLLLAPPPTSPPLIPLNQNLPQKKSIIIPTPPPPSPPPPLSFLPSNFLSMPSSSKLPNSQTPHIAESTSASNESDGESDEWEDFQGGNDGYEGYEKWQQPLENEEDDMENDGFGALDDLSPSPDLADSILKGLDKDYDSVMDYVMTSVGETSSSTSSSYPIPPARKAAPPAPPSSSASSQSFKMDPDGKPPVVVDVSAVARAVKSIKLKNPKLAETLDRGARSLPMPSSSPTALSPVPHPIIAPLQTLAWVSPTPKAIAASNILSRACTMAEAVDMLSLLDGKPDSILVDVVGVDVIDCGNAAIVERMFKVRVSPSLPCLPSHFNPTLFSHQCPPPPSLPPSLPPPSLS